MKLKLISFLICLSFTACQSNKDIDIIGSWTSTNMKDNTGMNLSDKVDFKKDGSYLLTMYANGDSVLSESKGSYEIDQGKHILTININGIRFRHQIIDLEKESLRLQTAQGIEITMKRIK